MYRVIIVPQKEFASKGENAVRTLKTFIIAALLFLFATPAISSTSTPQLEMPFLFSFAMSIMSAAAYPPEMPDIQSAPIQFVCETSSLWFLKVYIAKTWQVLIMGRDKKEVVLDIMSRDEENKFVFILTTGAWKNVINLESEKIDELLEKSFGYKPNEEDDQALLSCVDFNLRSRGLSR